MPLVEAQQQFLNLTEAVADAGYGLQTFRDVPTEKVFEALHNAGYSEVLTDNGQVMWTKPWWNTTGATSTATAGETMGQNLLSTVTTEAGSGTGLVNITASSVGFTTEVSSVTEGVSMIATTPKLAVVTAVASACGLAFGFDLGQELVDQYFGDDNFDWSTDSIGAKIITFISGEKTYVDEDLANRIKDRLIDIGAFEDGSITTNTISKNSGWNTINPIPLSAFILNCNLSDIYKNGLLMLAEHFNIGGVSSIYSVECESKVLLIKIYNSNTFYIGKYNANYSWEPSGDFGNPYPNDFWQGYFATNGRSYPIPVKTDIGETQYRCVINTSTGELTDFSSGTRVVHDLFNGEKGTDITIISKTGSSHKFYGINIGLNVTQGGLPGVKKQPNAIYPTKNTPVTTTYPDWGTNKGKVPTKDGKKTVIPLTLPKENEGTDTQNEAQSGKYPETDTDPYIGDLIIDVQLPNNPDNIPTKDDGDTPIPIIPATGVQGTGFVALYNPTQSQLSAFSQYLWSNDFIENFKKLFSNPMDAIIGLHLIYATPSRGDVAEIVCGYSHSGVMSNTVNNQYIEIDCGGIKVNRYFGNVLDYAPYTKLQVYLPFVGIVDLDTNEIMNGTLNIKYRIDVLTGSCLARLKIKRGDYKAELYNFAGNCAVQLPISGGSYSGIIANAIGVAGSLGATIATGGAMAPVLVGSVVSSAVNSRTNVSHSGSLGSNAGALGIMKPYLIITRPKPAEANNFNEFYGRPSNKKVRLSSCSGYTRIKDVHIEKISSATDDELNEIESLLKDGVII